MPKKRKNPNYKIALMLENFVSNPNLSNEQLSNLSGLTIKDVWDYKSFWFPYRGENKKILVLKSKI